jgi:flagellar protein FliL
MSKAPKKADAAKGGEGGDAPPAKSKKKLLIIVVAAVVLLGAAGGAAAWFMGHKNHDKEGASEAKKEVKVDNSKPPVFMNLEPFTVNLNPDEGEQYLQTAITLKVASNEVSEQLSTHLPEVRSRILLLLSSKKASEIATIAGKTKLADEVLETVKQPFSPKGPEQEVVSVFFTQFVIQ